MPSDNKDWTPEQTVGENVRRFRALANLTQEQLAFRSDKHRTYIGAIERGERNITIRALFEIADALGVDSRKLLTPPGEFDYP